MSKSRREKCIYCHSFVVKKNGSKGRKQRFYCKTCTRYFTRLRPDISQSNRFIWFRQWIEYGHSIEHISQYSGYSERTLKRHFYEYLKNYPKWHILPSKKVNLLIDGTYFSNKICLILYQDNNVKATQLYRLTDSECFNEVKEDLENLLSLGICIESVTCDDLYRNYINGICFSKAMNSFLAIQRVMYSTKIKRRPSTSLSLHITLKFMPASCTSAELDSSSNSAKIYNFFF